MVLKCTENSSKDPSPNVLRSSWGGNISTISKQPGCLRKWHCQMRTCAADFCNCPRSFAPLLLMRINSCGQGRHRVELPKKCTIWGWVKTLVPSEPQNSWDLWMFIPLKMYLYWPIPISLADSKIPSECVGESNPVSFFSVGPPSHGSTHRQPHGSIGNRHLGTFFHQSSCHTESQGTSSTGHSIGPRSHHQWHWDYLGWVDYVVWSFDATHCSS